MTAIGSRAIEVPFTRMDDADPVLLDELLATVERVARSAAFTGGSEVAAFEDELAAYCEVDHTVGVSSGTEALVLSLRALEIGPGDEVIVPAATFVATAEAVSLAGATPVFVDVDPVTYTLTAENTAPAITPRTRCVIPVHLYGRTADLDPLVALCERHGVALIEDACQAHGAWYRGRRVGGIGTLGCFSFYPAKNLGGWGDGGAVVTGDAALADRIRLLRSHGERPRYRHRLVGSTARLDGLQAAILRVKLRRLEEWTAGRRSAAAALTAALEHLDLELPAPAGPAEDHVFHLYVVGVENRDAFRDALQEAGVATGVHYPVALHRTEAYASLYGDGPALPVAERLAARGCSLPMFPGMTDAEISHIADAAAAALGLPEGDRP